MYQPWGNDPADAIIKLIEEKEEKRVKYSLPPYDNNDWSIVSYKQIEETGEEIPKRKIKPETTAEQWRRGPRQLDSRASWGSKIADSINKQLKAEKDVELTIRKRSNSSEERPDFWPRRRQASPQVYEKRSRSRSRSIPRHRKPHRCSSNSRTKRRSRSRSTSREIKRKRSVSRDRKRERSDSRDRKRRRRSSRDRKADRSDQYRSRSRSTERKRDTRSKSRRSRTPKAQDKPVETTTEILTRFVSMLQEAKKEQPPAPAQIAPSPNVLPEFDSNNMGHAITTWLLRVDDVAKLFGWGDKETIQYALPKLVGDAQTWYQTLENVPYTWADWKKTLKEKFPSPSYGRLLTVMTKRHALPTETLEKYYFDKMLSVNRCGFKGRYAVDCVLSGVKLESIWLCAEAANFAEPEELLKYFKSVEAVWLEHNAKSLNTTKDGLPTQKKAAPICAICGKIGHTSFTCWYKQGGLNAKANPDQTLKANAPTKALKKCNSKPPCKFVRPFIAQQPNLPGQPSDKKPKLCHLCREAGHLKSACPQKKEHDKQSSVIDNNIVVPADASSSSAAVPSVNKNSALSAAGNMNEPAPPGVE